MATKAGGKSATRNTTKGSSAKTAKAKSGATGGAMGLKKKKSVHE
jgi:hypothetical protein